MLAQALAFVARGWHVVPLHSVRADGRCTCVPAGSEKRCSLDKSDRHTSAGKHPRTTNGHHDATIDPEQIRAWWTANPTANIGISLEPSGLVALDVDVSNGKRGAASLAEIALDLPDTLLAETGSGGRHYIFTRPPGTHAGRKINFKPGLDLLGKGYIVAAPSTHESGGTYRWLDDSPPAPLPEFLVRAAGAPKASVSDRTPTTDYPPASPALLAEVQRRLALHGPAIEGQGGDQHTYRACAIAINDGALSEAEALAVLSIWDAGNSPPWGIDGLAEKMRNAASYASKQRGFIRESVAALEAFAPTTASAPLETDTADGTDEPPPQHDTSTWEGQLAQAYGDVLAALKNSPEHGGSPPPMFTPINALLSRTDWPPTQWLVHDLVTSGGTLLTSGGPKTAIKTWSLVEIATAVATGTPAYGRFRTSGAKRVAYFFAEDLDKAVRNRFRACLKHRHLTSCENLFVQPRGRFLDVLNDGDLALIVASVRQLGGVDLLILEPLRDIHSGEENESDDMAQVMKRLRLLGELLHCTIGGGHHSNKGEGGNGGRDMRGSGAIHGSIDSGLYVDKPRGNNRTEFTNRVKSEVKAARSAGTFDLTLKIEDDAQGEAESVEWSVTLQVSDASDEDEEDASNATIEQRVLNHMSACDPGTMFTKSALRSNVTGSNERVDAAVDTLVKRGRIRITKGSTDGTDGKFVLVK